ncbi:hypothetical protein Tsubulata_025779 [Turnera subulata]|uniref:Growth-regulating factor n=1 Tax=Turnera subulata TaxID=218843 RepID=A0A9Q0JPX5_9ROSI|nr:hypothetical protein Tsubulata_025779 [Turnera subulata]
MDFGVVGLDGLVGSGTTANASSGFSNHKWYGSGCLKQGRPAATSEDDWRSSKLSKTESMLLPQRSSSLLKSNTVLFSDGQQQQHMLSFSSPKPALSLERSAYAASLPYFHLTSSAPSKNTGYNSGSFNGPSLHGAFSETKGPFTPSQWMELEHQALIYKYITANVPIPSTLLIPIRKAFDSAGFSGFAGGLLRPNTLPWGAFHFGFPGSTDPEPGRCRRTDGKKWRCSRDAVPDQKYCERHINRGRHRSRKPVEGQSGLSAAKPKPAAPSSSSASAAVVGPLGGGMPSSLIAAQHHQQLNKLQPVDSSNNVSPANPLGRMFPDKENVTERSQDSPCLSMLSSNTDLKSKENSFLMSKQQVSYEDSLRTEFGLVTSDSLLNPSQKSSSSMLSCTKFGSSHSLADQETASQQSLRQFMEDWPKSHSDRSAVSCSGLDLQSARTQLSISTPVASTDFMSSTSSPNNGKANLSPLRLSFDPIQMGLGVGGMVHESNQRQPSWIPISWETSIGGPLGEVLNNTNNGAGEGKNSSALNLMTEGWDNSPRLGSSPTGVLQKAVFGSLSNSSAGSSPRAENAKSSEGAGLCNDLLGSTLLHSASLPAL